MTAHQHFESPEILEYDKINRLPHIVTGAMGATGPTGNGYPYYQLGSTGPTGTTGTTPYTLGSTGPTGVSIPPVATGAINPTSNYNALTNAYNGVSSIYTTPQSNAQVSQMLNPVQQPVQQQQQQQQGGGDTELQQLLKAASSGGLNPSQRSRLVELLGGQQQQAQGPSEQDINNIYNPLSTLLNQQQSQYESQYPMYQQQVEGQTAAGLKDVSNQESVASANLANQQTGVNTAETSALAQARQLYGELAQRYGSMFGSRTSAGPFAMEILSRETQKQFGNIGQTATQGTQAVKQAATQLGNWVDTQKQTWNQKKTDALNNLQISFNNTIAGINSQRGQMESDKANKRYQALVDAKAQADQIQQADKTFSQQLALFQAQNQNPATYSQGNVVGNQVAQLQTPYNPSGLQGNQGQLTSAAGSQYNLPGNAKWEFDPTTGQYRQVPSGMVSNTG